MLLFHIDTSGNHARNIMAWTTECRKSYSTFLFPTKEVECKPCRLPKKKKKKTVQPAEQTRAWDRTGRFGW